MKYGSRKFIVTCLGMLGASVLAYYGKMNSDIALVLSAGIASYNGANAYVGNKDG